MHLRVKALIDLDTFYRVYILCSFKRNTASKALFINRLYKFTIWSVQRKFLQLCIFNFTKKKTFFNVLLVINYSFCSALLVNESPDPKLSFFKVKLLVKYSWFQIYPFQRIPLNPSVEYSLHFDFKIRGDHQKNFVWASHYESVDVRSIFWITYVPYFYGKQYSGSQRVMVTNL